MTICLVTPAPPRSRHGNRVTALRWARILRALGHRVAIEQEWDGCRCDLLIALHARRSYSSIDRFHRNHPGAPLIVALTGTDLYGDIHSSAEAQRSLEWASRLVLLQPHGIVELPIHVRDKVRIIYQSVSVPFPTNNQQPATNNRSPFSVCVIGHLRPVKDPLRAAEAARLLPLASRIEVLHLGAALSDEMEQAARAEMAANPRYRWLGGVPRGTALRTLASCRLLVLTSLSEGGANVVSEALALGVPVLSSHISGSIGLLGDDYPGYFPVGDTRALADLLRRAECDAGFYESLRAACAERRPLIDPIRERQSWECLLQEFKETR